MALACLPVRVLTMGAGQDLAFLSLIRPNVLLYQHEHSAALSKAFARGLFNYCFGLRT